MYIALHCTTLRYIVLYCITLHYIALHCMALRNIASQCASHSIIIDTYMTLSIWSFSDASFYCLKQHYIAFTFYFCASNLLHIHLTFISYICMCICMSFGIGKEAYVAIGIYYTCICMGVCSFITAHCNI